MKLNETTFIKGQILESDSTKLPKGVLCRGTWPVSTVGKLNANKRMYEDKVWEGVIGNTSIKEKQTNRVLFGHAEHPDRTQSDLQLTSHVITDSYLKDLNAEEASKYDLTEGKYFFQNLDVLDTPCGKIVNTLLQAGCRVGVSTRAEGDLQEMKDKDGNVYSRVVPESYKYVTTDFTADPSTFGTKPMDLVLKEAKEQLKSGKLTEAEKQFDTILLEEIKAAGQCVDCEGGCKTCGNKKEDIKKEDIKMEESKHCTKCSKDKCTCNETKVEEVTKDTKKVDEANVNITLDNGTNVTVTGTAVPVSVGADGMVVVSSDTTKVEPIADIKPVLEPLDNPPIDLPKEDVNEPIPTDAKLPEEPEEDIVDEIEAAKEDTSVDNPFEMEEEEAEAEEEEEELGESKILEKSFAYDVFVMDPDSEHEEEIDTVFYSTQQDPADVKKSLVDHDGYDANIIVRAANEARVYEVSCGKKKKKMIKAIKKSEKKAGKSDKKATQIAYATANKNESKYVFESFDDMVAFIENETIENKVKVISKLTETQAIKSLTGISKELLDLKIKKASAIAEATTAMELLVDLEAKYTTSTQSRQLEADILTKRVTEAKTVESQELTALRTLLETKVKALNENIKQLDETKKACDELNAKLAESSTLNESTKLEAQTKLDEQKKILSDEFNVKLIKEYISMKAGSVKLKLPTNSQALLEKCTTLKEVDEIFDSVRTAMRRSALLPETLNESTIEIVEKEQITPVDRKIQDSIVAGLEGAFGL